MELNNVEIDVLIELIRMGKPKYSDFIFKFDGFNNYISEYYENRFCVACDILDKLYELKRTKESEEK